MTPCFIVIIGRRSVWVQKWVLTSARINSILSVGIVQLLMNQSLFLEVSYPSVRIHPLQCLSNAVNFTEFNSLLPESRERAYVYAISAAGAAYAVTRACSRGEITECGCDGKIRQRQAKGFEWGGCSEVIYLT